MSSNAANPSTEPTLPSRPSTPARRSFDSLTGVDHTTASTPWILHQFFQGEIDLDGELSKRFPVMPLMSVIHFRSTAPRHAVASLSTQDGAASVLVDVDTATRSIEFTFITNSMLALRFALSELSDMDRSRWMEAVRRDQEGLAFLWGKARWESNYLICAVHRYYVNFYAFSPHNFAAAARLTPDMAEKLLIWLESFWQAPPNLDDSQRLLTTW